jgi:hypothetical protein
MRDLAAAYDRAAIDVGTVESAMGRKVEDWTGPSVPSVWHAASTQVRSNTLIWERDWQYVLGRGRRGRALKRQVYVVRDLAAEVQARLDISGWQADMAQKQVALLAEAIDVLQRDLRRRAAR